jgi:hypothetical protein
MFYLLLGVMGADVVPNQVQKELITFLKEFTTTALVPTEPILDVNFCGCITQKNLETALTPFPKELLPLEGQFSHKNLGRAGKQGSTISFFQLFPGTTTKGVPVIGHLMLQGPGKDSTRGGDVRGHFCLYDPVSIKGISPQRYGLDGEAYGTLSFSWQYDFISSTEELLQAGGGAVLIEHIDVLKEKNRRNGFATLMVQKLIQLLLDCTRCRTIYTSPRTEMSLGLFKKLGFQEDGDDRFVLQLSDPTCPSPPNMPGAKH